MLKFMLLSSTRYFAPDKEDGSDKSPAQIERDKIKVESTGTKTLEREDDNKKEDNSENDESNSEKSGEKGEDESKESGEEGDEEGEDEDEEEVKELTTEEFKKQVDALQKKVSRLERRTGKTTGERDQLRKDLASAKTKLEAKVAEGGGLTEEDVEARAEAKAEQKANERAFNKACEFLNKAATKIDKDFITKINEVANDVAPIPGAMIGILEDLDNGGAVLAYLADNPDDYEEIHSLPITKMSLRLSRLSDKILEASKEKPKKISKVPAPIEKIKGNESTPTILPANPTKDMSSFVRIRQQQVEARRKARLA